MAKKRIPKQLTLEVKKPLPKMPKGYYLGEKRNPNLRPFVEAHLGEKTYDPEKDDYCIAAFNKPIKTTKANRIYNIHPYWSKKPPDAIEEYILHYTEKDDLVLDPFCGSGTTALAAIQHGRKAVAIDLSPAATFITRTFCTYVSPEELQKAYERVVEAVSPVMDWLYETRCNRCGGEATISHTVLSATFQCTRCLAFVPIYHCETRKSGKRNVKLCPLCLTSGNEEEISAKKNMRGELLPVEVFFDCLGGCKPVRSSRILVDQAGKDLRQSFDKKRSQEIANGDIPFWYPNHDLPNPTLSHRLYKQGIQRHDQLFTKRNLWALSALRANILEELEEPLRSSILSGFSSILIKGSHLMGHGSDGVGRVFSGAYYPQSVRQEANIMKYFKIATSNLIKGIEEVENVSTFSERLEVMISTQPAQDLSELPDNSVDYIFTDPPYADKVPFWELNLLWEAWLGFSSEWEDRELVLNKRRNKLLIEYEKLFHKCFGEAYRVLKPGRWMSLTYHDTSEGTWHLVQDVMAELGFLVDESDQSLFIDATTPTIHHIKDSKIVKRDLVINFRKPRLGELYNEIILKGDEDESTFREKLLMIIRDFLLVRPGATNDRIYDEVVSRLVRKGRMEAFDFDKVLSEIAEPITEPVMKNLFEPEDPDLFGTHQIKRWYLKENADLVDEAETVREDAAAEKLEAFMKIYLRKHPERQGVHYSDLFEQILTMDRPRREMADWLIDYFYKTEGGTWRPPMTEEERKEKASQRATGALRKIKTFARLLESNASVPERLQPESDHQIADWVHQARRSGLYHQGKVIFERSGLNLSRLEEVDENLAMDVNEDYQYCLKQLGGG